MQPPSYEYSTIFQNDRQIIPVFCPPKKALGGEIVPRRKKFPQHVSQKLLILLTLPRQAAAAVPFKSEILPFLCRLCAASTSTAPSGKRFVAE